jgi:uncharacterized protein YacL
MIYIVRAVFLAMVATVALTYTLQAANTAVSTGNAAVYYVMIGGVVTAFAVIAVDVAFRKKNLKALSGLIFGVLVGVLASLCVGFLIDQVTGVFMQEELQDSRIKTLLQGLKLLVGLIITYASVSFILQTKDDFRFIIPYVEFARATKGPRPLILDTSVIIDGRIADMAATGVFESPLVVPRFVLNELQTIADSGDHLKRRRGRRGLDVLDKLKQLPKLELRFWDGTLTNVPEGEGVDQKLVALAKQENGRLVTNDFNLNKIASLRGVDVVNINSIADSLKPVVLPGENMKVRIVKPGENAGQGVGYLEDGTMVVVEGARDRVGVEIEVTVTNVIQNPAGKMIFGRVEGGGGNSSSASKKSA